MQTLEINRGLPDYLAETLTRLANSQHLYLYEIIQRLVLSLQEGHVCLRLSDAELHTLRQAIQQSPGIVGTPGQFYPLILDGDRLYLTRYWQYETGLAHQLLKRMRLPTPSIDEARLITLLDQLFPASDSSVDWQKVAATAACLQRFTIISGGPGTGKTSTVLRLLLLLQGLAVSPLRIRLAAPTGKAAARMGEGIRNAVAKLSDTLRETFATSIAQLPNEAETLHRLLGTRGNQFMHHAMHPLSLDVLVVDEASMIDQAMMFHLFEALPPNAIVILLGDKDQLSSVEAGSVFADLCQQTYCSPARASLLSRLTKCPVPSSNEANLSAVTHQLDMFTAEEVTNTGTTPSKLAAHIQVLHHSYRFARVPGIGALANTILAQQASQLSSILSHQSGLHWYPEMADEERLERLCQGYADYFESVRQFDGHSHGALMQVLDRFRILTAVKAGPYGAEGINKALERRFQLRHWIHLDRALTKPVYKGLALMITQNDYQAGLFNGDIGLVLPDETGTLVAWFPVLNGPWRRFSLSRLPGWQSAWAMTIHKSQGSEFDHVAIVLPGQYQPILNRALLYTAVTRAKTEVSIWGSESVLSQTTQHHPERMSGLLSRLSLS